jgi:hypothetical protein
MTRGEPCWLILGAILLPQAQKVGWDRRLGLKLREEDESALTVREVLKMHVGLHVVLHHGQK